MSTMTINKQKEDKIMTININKQKYQRDLDRIRAKKIVSASMPRIVREVLSGKFNNKKTKG